MRQIGQDLPFPQKCVLLGDKIYPNAHPVITLFTQSQIRRKPDRLQRKCRKFNRTLSEYRVLVEHVIGELKCYKVIGTLWRHPRTKLKRVTEICAGLLCRRRKLNKTKLTIFFYFNFQTSPSYYTIIVVVSSPSPIV